MTRIYLSPPDMTPEDRELLLDAFDSNWVAPLGPHVDAFEKEMCEKLGVGFAAALSSGTAALHLALVLLEVGPGDEVIIPTLTFSATANAVTYVGATPVLVDSTPASWNIDPELLEEAIAERVRRGRKPKAMIPVDLYGQCADYDRIRAICQLHEIPIIEDAAEALGASYGGRSAGSLGEMGVLSFNGNKIITTSGGGMLLSDRRDWIELARHLATQARDPAPHYQHSKIGYNYRMSNLLAAVGRGQLRSRDRKVERRRAHNAFYRRALGDLPGISFMPEASHGRSTFWLTTMLVDAGAAVSPTWTWFALAPGNGGWLSPSTPGWRGSVVNGASIPAIAHGATDLTCVTSPGEPARRFPPAFATSSSSPRGTTRPCP